jgi:putative ABC transport system permease protein
MLADLKYAVRTLRKSPVFAATAIGTIALGIGASAALFSVTNAVLLRKLPYREPDRLVFLINDMEKRNVKDFPLSNADFLDLRNGTPAAFDELGAVRTQRATFPGPDDRPEQVRIAVVTTNFFRLMGGAIATGRDFTDADGQPQPAPAAPGSAAPAGPQLPAMAILSHSYWQRRFGGDPGILGKPIPGARGQNVVVGVLAPGFELYFPPESNVEKNPDIWFANRLDYDAALRNTVSLRAIGRLKDAVSVEKAQSSVDAVGERLRAAYTIARTAGQKFRLVPMQSYVVAGVRPALLALMGAVVFLLLIACANVANLMLVRSALRGRELAIRTALGGPRRRLVMQTLAEALLVAIVGGAAGVGLAYAGIAELRAIAPANLPLLERVAIDPTVVIFAAVCAAVSSAIFGLAPALRASRPDIAQVLRAAGRTAGLGGGGMLRNAVVVAEVALAFVLLVGCGLMFRTFVELQRIDPGYDPNHLLTFQLLGGRPGPQAPQRAAYQQNILNRLRAIPGVQAATAVSPFPLAGGFSPIRWGLESALTDPTRFQAVDFQLVVPGYFETMKTRLLAGRTFTDADNVPERNVVVVDQALAAKAFPNQSAVGKRILIRIRTPEPEWVEILGVVQHTRDVSLAEPGREQIYFTDGFLQHAVATTFALRTSGDPAGYSTTVRAEIAKLGGGQLINELQPMQALVDKSQAGTRFTLLLIGVFAGIAALLAAVGLYGVLATVVRQRTAEIGVRMALGADPGKILQLVVSHGLRLSLAGLAAGAVAAFWMTSALTRLLVGVQPTDPATFVAMAALFLAVAALASWLPARRAARLDPTVALREE